MTDDDSTPATPVDPGIPAPEVPLIQIPKIDFTVPSDIPLTEVRKGFGLGDVGATGPTGPAGPTPAPDSSQGTPQQGPTGSDD
jgi:hypothetical protein